MAPALAAGNCCVVKPSELASLTTLELGAIAQEVGLPAGVLNIITGTGADAGAPLRWVAGELRHSAGGHTRFLGERLGWARREGLVGRASCEQ